MRSRSCSLNRSSGSSTLLVMVAVLRVVSLNRVGPSEEEGCFLLIMVKFIQLLTLWW